MWAGLATGVVQTTQRYRWGLLLVWTRLATGVAGLATVVRGEDVL